MDTPLRALLEGLDSIKIDPAYLDELEQLGALPLCEIPAGEVTTKRLVVHRLGDPDEA